MRIALLALAVLAAATPAPASSGIPPIVGITLGEPIGQPHCPSEPGLNPPMCVALTLPIGSGPNNMVHLYIPPGSDPGFIKPNSNIHVRTIANDAAPHQRVADVFVETNGVQGQDRALAYLTSLYGPPTRVTYADREDGGGAHARVVTARWTRDAYIVDLVGAYDTDSAAGGIDVMTRAYAHDRRNPRVAPPESGD